VLWPTEKDHENFSEYEVGVLNSSVTLVHVYDDRDDDNCYNDDDDDDDDDDVDSLKRKR